MEEAYAFALATVRKRAKLSARLLVVKNSADWDLLIRNSLPLILMPQFEDTTNLGYAVDRGHFVILSLSLSQRTPDIQIVLPQIEENHRVTALVSMGVPVHLAKSIVGTSRGYLSVIRRHPALAIDKRTPIWATPERAKIALSAMLAGSWADRNENDRKFLESLSSIPYYEFEHNLHLWVISGDPLAELIDNEWQLVSYIDSWPLLNSYVSSAVLENFFKHSKDVLIEEDPSFELPPDERWMANAIGKVTSYSSSLRKGIAVMLALLGSHGDKDCKNKGSVTIQQYVSAVLYEILKKDMSEKAWYSIYQEIVFLAEAAPERFMDAVESSLKAEKPSIMALFIEGSMGHCFHTGLLGGLEALSWNQDYFPRIVKILAKLAQLDPGGRFVNRPFNTLTEIFNCRFPQTKATLDERLAVLEWLITVNPEIGWKLLVRLIPDKVHKGPNDLIYQPHFHPWATGWTRIPESEVEAYSIAIQECFLNNALCGPPSRWLDVLDQLSNLQVPFLERAIAGLRNNWQQFPKSVLLEIREKLRTLIAQHREFANAFWALPQNYVNEVEKIYLSMLPDDLIEKNRYLFDNYDPDLPNTCGRLKYRERMALVENERIEVIKSIWSTQGIAGIELLVSQVKLPKIIGSILVNQQFSDDVEKKVLEWLGSDNDALAQTAMGFTWSMYLKNNDWLLVTTSKYSTNWPNKAWINFCLSLPLSSALITLLERLDQEIQKKFWADVNYLNLRKEDSKCVNIVLERLLTSDRPFAVIVAGNSYLSEPALKAALNYELLITALEWVVSKPSDISAFGQSVGYEISELLKEFESGVIQNDTRLAYIEWTYLPVFSDWEIQPNAIMRNLLANAKLLVEIACLSFSAVLPVEGESSNIPQELRMRYASNTLQLLTLIERLPGQDESKKIDISILEEWVDLARNEFKAKNRVRIGDELIGRMLFHAPIGEDDVWPHKAVRKIIEKCESTDIERGMECQHLEQRGATMRALGDGGKQEREIADGLLKDADKLNYSSPRTALLLRKIAENYQDIASSNDNQDKKLISDFR